MSTGDRESLSGGPLGRRRVFRCGEVRSRPGPVGAVYVVSMSMPVSMFVCVCVWKCNTASVKWNESSLLGGGAGSPAVASLQQATESDKELYLS